MSDPHHEPAPNSPGISDQPTSEVPPPPPQSPYDSGVALSDSEVQSKKILCGVLGILLGAFGVHKFILGYTQPAVIMLVVSVVGIITSCFLFGLPTMAMGIIGLVEGIIYLTKTDAEFREMYLKGQKHWF